MKKSPDILSRSLVGASLTSLFVFFLFSSVFTGNLGPIPALIYGPIAFLVAFVVFLFIETLLTRQSRKTRKRTYLVVFAISLAPVVIYIGINPQDFTRAGRMEHAAPLTEEEELLLKSTRLNFRVGVVNTGRPSVYTRSLIGELQETCLFIEVGDDNELEKADVLATMKGAFWDDKHGFTFIFHFPEHPSEGVEIRVFYKLSSGMSRGGRDQRQYIDRLSVELIKASQTLFGQSELVIIDPSIVQADEQVDCRRH
jgi:hypothetical protein